MRQPANRVWKILGIVTAAALLYGGVQVASYATARPEAHEFTLDGNRWRYTHTKSLKILPLRDWGFGTLIGCGRTGGETVRTFGFIELDDRSWNTLLSRNNDKGRIPGW